MRSELLLVETMAPSLDPARRSGKARRTIRFLIALSWLACAVAWLLIFVDAETVLGTGPVIALTSTAAIIAGIVAKSRAVCAIGAAHWAICLLFFGLVNLLNWGPHEAQVPFLSMGFIYLSAITPLSWYVWRRLPPARMPWECAKCGYLLYGLTKPRCPECGTPFVPSHIPSDAATRCAHSDCTSRA